MLNEQSVACVCMYYLYDSSDIMVRNFPVRLSIAYCSCTCDTGAHILSHVLSFVSFYVVICSLYSGKVYLSEPRNDDGIICGLCLHVLFLGHLSHTDVPY